MQPLEKVPSREATSSVRLLITLRIFLEFLKIFCFNFSNWRPFWIQDGRHQIQNGRHLVRNIIFCKYTNFQMKICIFEFFMNYFVFFSNSKWPPFKMADIFQNFFGGKLSVSYLLFLSKVSVSFMHVWILYELICIFFTFKMAAIQDGRHFSEFFWGQSYR